MEMRRIAIAAALLLPVAGAGATTDENLRRHAIAYAGLIARAHDVLTDHIERGSGAPVRWTGAAVPAAQTGWRQAWTEQGLRARYCDGELLVYLGAGALKGTGEHHRDVQMAPRLYLGASDTGLTLPPLHWLDGRRVEGEGLGTVILPGCMASMYGEALPRGRAALLSSVPDPWLERRTREHHETRDVACGSGRHGDGVRERRRVSREQNGRGDWVGEAAYGPWEVLVDTCRDDYVYHRSFSRACTWYQGEPFNREMHGIRRWRQAMEVSARGERPIGAPQLVGTTCWDETGGPPPTDEPSTVVTTDTEDEERDCEEGYTGSVWFERTLTTTTTTLPWDSVPIVTVSYGAWQERSNTCERIHDDDDHDDDEVSDEDDRPDGGGPGCDSCGRPGDPCDF